MKQKIIVSFFFLISVVVYSQQKNINNYKYIIVPNQFSFLKKVDQYQTSSLTKFLMQKKGFVAFKSNENLPEDLTKNNCLALTADVINHSGLFSTKSQIQLRDCFNAIVYTSKIGKSKLKEYKKAYHEAIREAFDSMSDLEYTYRPVKVLEDKMIVENISEKKATTAIPKTKKMVTNQPVKKDVLIKKQPKNVLYAQPKKNGFQLVDTKPEVVYYLLKTNVKDFFIVKDRNGILYKKGDDWMVELYKGNQIVVKKYEIKF